METSSARFKGKAALITGGGSGIGRACGLRIAREGGAVCVADIRGDSASAVRAEIESEGGTAVAVVGDVASASDCERMVAATVEALGGLDVLVTSAGIHGGGQTVVDTSEETWSRVIGIDLTGAFLVSKFAVPHMRRAGGGAIAHVASIGGLRGSPNGTAFHSAKGGLVNLTRHMAVAHARENIRVNCVCPGVVRTPLVEQWLSDPQARRAACAWHPMNRIGRPEEIAAAVAFLCSEEAGFITGAILPVDGGHTAASPRWVGADPLGETAN